MDNVPAYSWSVGFWQGTEHCWVCVSLSLVPVASKQVPAVLAELRTKTRACFLQTKLRPIKPGFFILRWWIQTLREPTLQPTRLDFAANSIRISTNERTAVDAVETGKPAHEEQPRFAIFATEIIVMSVVTSLPLRKAPSGIGADRGSGLSSVTTPTKVLPPSSFLAPSQMHAAVLVRKGEKKYQCKICLSSWFPPRDSFWSRLSTESRVRTLFRYSCCRFHCLYCRFLNPVQWLVGLWLWGLRVREQA